MSRSRITPVACSTILFALLSGPLIAQVDTPSIQLTSASRAAFETEQSLIALEGRASARDGLANVNPGGQDVFVGNNNAANTCGVGAEASFAVKPTP